MEFKLLIFFAIFAFLVAIFSGWGPQIGVGDTLKRAIFATVIFGLLGYGIGYLIRLSLPEVTDIFVRKKKRGKGKKKYKEEVIGEIKLDKDLFNNDKPSVNMNNVPNIGPSITKPAPDIELSTSEPAPDNALPPNDFEPVKDDGDVPLVSPTDPKHMKVETVGDYMMINDKKIENNPEKIAKALRTMMSKDD